jgi:hypothetical protein
MDKVKHMIPAVGGMNKRPVTSPLSGIMALMCKKIKGSETNSKSVPTPNQRSGEAFFVCGAFLMCILSCILDARSSDRTAAHPFPRIIAAHCTRRQKGVGNREICRYFRRCGMVSVGLLCGCISSLVHVAQGHCSLGHDTSKLYPSKYIAYVVSWRGFLSSSLFFSCSSHAFCVAGSITFSCMFASKSAQSVYL